MRASHMCTLYFQARHLPQQPDQAPNFDPLGFAKNVDDQELQKYREAEIKHGENIMQALILTSFVILALTTCAFALARRRLCAE
jgi:multisubunit Na+/H+ antiporter MnhC subunit